MNAASFYTSVCACPNTALECPGVINSASTGWPPRGFFTEATESPIEILVVGKNPGHPLPEESSLYEGRSAAEIAAIHLAFAGGVFKGEHDTSMEARRSTRFHKNLRRYLAFFLDCPESDVFRRAAYTNLVKCSSPGEQDRLNLKTMNECFARHFIRELAFFRPRLLLALGREVENFLRKASASGLHGFPVVYIKHPSYHYRKDQEFEILHSIKADIHCRFGD